MDHTDHELLRTCRTLLSLALEGLECESETERELIYYRIVNDTRLTPIDDLLYKDA